MSNTGRLSLRDLLYVLFREKWRIVGVILTAFLVAVAYLARERSKGGAQDIAKAAHHLQKLVEVMAEQEADAAKVAADPLPYLGPDRQAPNGG